MYHNSSNYGGLLQAYALCRFLNLRGVQAEQICYSNEGHGNSSRLSNIMSVGHLERIAKIQRGLKSAVNSQLTRILVSKKNEQRIKATIDFRNKIPHSNKVYSSTNIRETDDVYDAFITGSDRVWNPMSIGNPYYLSFVKDKPKASYAASLASSSLTERQREQFREVLKGYSLVSVRERETVELLDDLSPINVEWVVDPTFLLGSDEWSEICTSQTIPGHYVFCYFLGGDKQNRSAAEQYAKRKNLCVVTIPYANNRFIMNDILFGEKKLSDASPEMFVSLIKNADCVFTDSFHATVFSTIFHKEVFSFTRSDMVRSGSRIESLTGVLGTSNRYCNTAEKTNIGYIIQQPPIDYEKADASLHSMIERSKELLDTYILSI